MDRADFLGCIDACFTQKQLKTHGESDWRDPVHEHSNSIFIPEDNIKSMEAFVALCWSQRPHRTEHQNSNSQEGFMEPSMQLPSSVLNHCNKSFVSADEKHQKASTQLYADTATMGLLCHHDHVLWVVNMSSAGEKQHYVIVGPFTQQHNYWYSLWYWMPAALQLCEVG